MTFGEAVDSMKTDNMVRRAGWPEQFGTGVIYKPSEEYSDPLFFIETQMGQIPWSPSHRDLEADDWEVVS